MDLAVTFFLLMVSHALADFVLQNETMVAGKNRSHSIHSAKGSQFPPWYYWLTAHGLIHGGLVFLVCNSLLLGLIETVLHAVLDFLKCENKISFHQDQLLHVLCKAAYCIFLGAAAGMIPV